MQIKLTFSDLHKIKFSLVNVGKLDGTINDNSGIPLKNKIDNIKKYNTLYMHQYKPSQLSCRKENCTLLRYYAASSCGPLKLRPVGCPETSLRIYHYPPRNNPEESSSRPRRGGSLKSRNL
jgi:hypothetical protein